MGHACRQTSFGAVVYEPGTRIIITYFFKDNYFWERDDGGKVSYTKSISYECKTLESNVDAAYTRLDGRIVFFKYSK